MPAGRSRSPRACCGSATPATSRRASRALLAQAGERPHEQRPALARVVEAGGAQRAWGRGPRPIGGEVVAVDGGRGAPSRGHPRLSRSAVAAASLSTSWRSPADRPAQEAPPQPAETHRALGRQPDQGEDERRPLRAPSPGPPPSRSRATARAPRRSGRARAPRSSPGTSARYGSKPRRSSQTAGRAPGAHDREAVLARSRIGGRGCVVSSGHVVPAGGHPRRHVVDDPLGPARTSGQ